jgi:hypothetical protein
MADAAWNIETLQAIAQTAQTTTNRTAFLPGRMVPDEPVIALISNSTFFEVSDYAG